MSGSEGEAIAAVVVSYQSAATLEICKRLGLRTAPAAPAATALEAAAMPALQDMVAT